MTLDAPFGMSPRPAAAQHTWTPGCDGHHDPGPCPARADDRHEYAHILGGPPGGDIQLRDVQRLELHPGDRLICRHRGPLGPDEAAHATERIAAALGIHPSRVLVTDDDWDFTVESEAA